MKIHHLRALVATADTGSINAAARSLHITQPAVTKALRELEDEFGVLLLKRNQWGVAPTPEGTVLLDRARAIVREMARAEEDMAHLKGSRDGHLIVGVTAIAGTAGMTEAFLEFRKRWPDVNVEFRELGMHQLSEQLNNGTLDLAFGALSTPLGRIGYARELFAFEMAFVTRRNGRHAAVATLEALRDAEWIHTDVTEGYPTFVREMYREAGLNPPERITRCTSYALFYSLTLYTDAVFAWTVHSLSESVLSQQFVPLRLPRTPPMLSLYLLSSPESQLTRPAQYFLDCIHSTLAGRKLAGTVTPDPH